ncbi:hypothetical protein RHMOL_Rhmol12G0086300 [Rhododendron molle]|uniref:Uncharacterized protein n=1 Tax=Rhododendron molle TaxID=49168 RepID=A0ACC0LGC5_RHOML|nr:hypothetical protein RHMOL_Rhmol12G0086300 [Rhododendron molle]
MIEQYENKDSLVVVQPINEGNPNEHPQQAHVATAQILIARTGAVLSHIYTQANQKCRPLSKHGSEANMEDLMVTKEPPQSIWHFVLEDVLGIGWFRD